MNETEMQQDFRNSEPEVRIVGLPEASRMMGCSYVTAWRLANDGDLEAFRIRGNWKTSTEAVRKYIEKQRLDQVMQCKMKNGR